ncbi:MAG: hypothetical protein ACDS79_15110, partial [Enterobacteriaceae bacterium]
AGQAQQREENGQRSKNVFHYLVACKFVLYAFYHRRRRHKSKSLPLTCNGNYLALYCRHHEKQEQTHE